MIAFGREQRELSVLTCHLSLDSRGFKRATNGSHRSVFRIKFQVVIGQSGPKRHAKKGPSTNERERNRADCDGTYSRLTRFIRRCCRPWALLTRFARRLTAAARVLVNFPAVRSDFYQIAATLSVHSLARSRQWRKLASHPSLRCDFPESDLWLPPRRTPAIAPCST